MPWCESASPNVVDSDVCVLPCDVLCSDAVAPTLKALGLTPLMAAVLVGAAQNVFSKSAKYSLFDPCKEMAYIPLDDEVSMAGLEL